MDYATYKKLRAYCWRDLAPYLDSKAEAEGGMLYVLTRMHGAQAGLLDRESQQARRLFDAIDLTPREQYAAQLLAVISNHRAITYRREPTTKGARELMAVTPAENIALWQQTRAAVNEYAGFLPEREAAALLASLAVLDSANAYAEPPAGVAEADGVNFTVLATREHLIAAFGFHTGMEASWFRNLKDTPKLLAARKVKGQGGRGHIAEPWFCPLAVMQWLADDKCRKGRKLNTHKAWELLEAHFPKVYNAHSVADPRRG